MGRGKKEGFTLVEAIAATAILTMALAMALTGYVFMLKNANQGDVQHELDLDVQLAIESLKSDLRLSSMDEIFYFSTNGVPPYTAISFPIARVNPATGRINRDATTREIIWDQTTIYHIRPGSPEQLVRTTFSPRDNSLNDLQRQNQLNLVVADGGASSASSKILFANLLEWELNPYRGTFSGYAPTPSQEEITLGYALLESGDNSFTFKVVGRRPESTGYKIGLDQFLGSPSYSYREAELQTMSYSDTKPISVGNISYGNRHALILDASASGEEFTLVLDNDCWEETDFGDLTGGGYSEQDKTTVIPDYALDDIVVKLEGMETAWETEAQTGDFQGINWNTNLMNATVQIMLKGTQVDNGGHISGIGQRSRLTFMASTNSNLKIENVYFGESIDTSTTLDYNGAGTLVYFDGSSLSTVISAGASKVSEWIDVPIDKDKNYIVTYDIIDASALRTWKDLRASTLGTDMTTQITVPSGGTNIVQKYYLVPCLASAETSYVDKGIYTSEIFDTRLADHLYEYLAWNAVIPTGTKLSFKVRCGNNPDLSDADDFSVITENLVVLASSSFNISDTGRFVQYQALLESDSDHMDTPLLRDVTIDWAGERRMVNIMGKFSKGSDYANFELSVNGKPLQSAMLVNLNIFKEVPAPNNETRKISSAIQVEITPRNSSRL